MTIGPTISEMKKAVRTIFTSRHDVHAVFGFGSYFRGELYCDVDILVVFEPQCDPLLPRYYELRGDLEALGERLGVLFDLTVLTEREFAERPLRDMDSLVEIAR